jgi:hypothetical protein
MTDCLEVPGFGGEIAGELPEVVRVARGARHPRWEREWVRTDPVGTRHRSAYRLCQRARDELALIVLSRRGPRFIRWHDDRIIQWEQVATGCGGSRSIQITQTPVSFANIDPDNHLVEAYDADGLGAA